MNTAIMKPGILVSLKTELRGSVVYEREELEGPQPTIEVARDVYKKLRDSSEDPAQFEKRFKVLCGKQDPKTLSPVELIRRAEMAAGESTALIESWKTTKVIEDPTEHERAVKARNKARSLIATCCTPTSFGLLCPLSKEDELNEAVKGAHGVVSEFNATSKRARIGVYVLKGRIAENDEEATRAIASEVTNLLEAMENGIKSVDAKAIREAATKARQVATMLDESKQGSVKRAIEVARKAAREIVKRVDKGGEDAQAVLEEIATKPITSARFAFLDLGESNEEADGDALPAINMQRAANLDLH